MNEVKATMFMRIGNGKTIYQIASFEEAAIKFAEAEKIAHEHLNFKAPKVAILNSDMVQIARISPNGKVWDMDDNLLAGSVNLYK